MRTKVIILSLFLMVTSIIVIAQPENATIAKGNKLYKEGKFEEAIAAYQQALQQNPENITAKYNLAAARFRSSKFEEAQKDYEGVLEKTGDSKLKQKATYNNGVALTKQTKLDESIEAYKKALLLNPQDADTRFNLQKALEERHKQNKAKEQPQQQKKQEKKKEPQKQPPASRKQIEQWMQSLRQKEQEVQQKMQQNKNRSVNKPEKDW